MLRRRLGMVEQPVASAEDATHGSLLCSLIDFLVSLPRQLTTLHRRHVVLSLLKHNVSEGKSWVYLGTVTERMKGLS